MARNVVYDCAEDDEDGVMLVPARLVLRQGSRELDAEDDNALAGSGLSASMSSAMAADAVVLPMVADPAEGAVTAGETSDDGEGSSIGGGMSREAARRTSVASISSVASSSAHATTVGVAAMAGGAAVTGSSAGFIVLNQKALLGEPLYAIARRLLPPRVSAEPLPSSRDRMLCAIDTVLDARRRSLKFAGRVLLPDELGDDGVAGLAATSTNVTLRWRQVR